MNIKNIIGARIKELRGDLKISQETLANLAEVDRTYMTSVENGKRNVSIETLEKIICGGLDMSIQEFFSNDSFKKNKKKGK
jgi:transcriptional regulator with XRE-family HTH domain